jgi:hypothetical protein
MGLLRIIRHCLGTELKLVQQAENVSDLESVGSALFK